MSTVVPTLFFDLTRDQLRDWCKQRKMPAFRADQLLEWVYQKRVTDPQQMSNLSKADRDMLAREMRFSSARVLQHQRATDGVQKLLVQWDHLEQQQSNKSVDNAAKLPVVGQDDDARSQSECVMIPSEERKTACISSQVGCPVGCHFCASGLGGLDANLSAGQIVEQVWLLSGLPEVGRISNVVFMGMGEPLANFDAVTQAIATLMAPWGMGISGRRITLSTVGLPAQMRRLAELELPITLAISLHAPNDAIRRELIPWAQYVTVEQLIDAGRYFFDCTGREVTLEYTLLRGVNDQPEHARQLADVAKKIRSNINLIRYNEVAGIRFGRPEDDDVQAFQRILRSRGINTHIRASRGRDIAAACGQLRHEHVKAV